MSRHKPVKTARPLGSPRPRDPFPFCRQCGAAAGVEVTGPPGAWRALYCLDHYVPDTLSDAMRLDLCKCVIASRRTPPDANGLALKTGRALERRALVERAGPHSVIGGWVPTPIGLALVDGWEKNKTLGLQNAALFDKRFAQKGDLR